jgi:hypothetical protein
VITQAVEDIVALAMLIVTVLPLMVMPAPKFGLLDPPAIDEVAEK